MHVGVVGPQSHLEGQTCFQREIGFQTGSSAQLEAAEQFPQALLFSLGARNYRLQSIAGCPANGYLLQSLSRLLLLGAQDPAWEVREAAAWALAQWGESRHLERLLDDPHEAVRATASWGLGVTAPAAP